MNIKVLSRINVGFRICQAGELATMPDADALACIRAGAAEPADRRARRIVEAANAADQAAMELAATQLDMTGQDPRPRDSGGFLLALRVGAANRGTNPAGRLGGT